jgi:hypothetical protein
MNSAPDAIAEMALIDLSRIMRAAEDKHIRWYFAMLDAGIPTTEANSIVADIAAKDEREAA